MKCKKILLTFLILFISLPAFPEKYKITVQKDITYCSPDNNDLKLDLYSPQTGKVKNPAILVIHGGGWNGRDKSHKNFTEISEYFAKLGFVVFNINYRLAKVATAPAAVQDAHCAARFIQANAQKYKVDPNKVIATGNSAGCHLGLMVAMCQKDYCTGTKKEWSEYKPKLAGVINRFAITDVVQRTFGLNPRKSSINWIGGVSEKHKKLAQLMSPLNYVKEANLPPILSIHGARDSNTPVTDATRLHKLLKENQNESEILIIEKGGHGLHKLSKSDKEKINNKVRKFLSKIVDSKLIKEFQ